MKQCFLEFTHRSQGWDKNRKFDNQAAHQAVQHSKCVLNMSELGFFFLSLNTLCDTLQIYQICWISEW